MLKKVKVEEAVGLTLAHDITKVVPGEYKGPVFRRGHVVADADVAELKSIGKEHVYIMKLEPGEIHEEEAAIRIGKAVAGSGLELSAPKEGRVNITMQQSGLLKISVPLLERINSLGDILLTTLHNNRYCARGTMVAATKIIPLFTEEAKIAEVEAICKEKGKIIETVGLPKRKVGMVITGNEVHSGLREDAFFPAISKKVEKLGSVVECKEIVPDDVETIAHAVVTMKENRCDLTMICGGLSVDPDDVTLAGVIRSGANVVSYGAPVMPGAMFLVAELDGMIILGAPGAVIYNPTTILDLLLPRALAGETIEKKDIVALAHGGLCLNCGKCTFPICHFGK